jgi:hypothetical protein
MNKLQTILISTLIISGSALLRAESKAEAKTHLDDSEQELDKILEWLDANWQKSIDQLETDALRCYEEAEKNLRQFRECNRIAWRYYAAWESKNYHLHPHPLLVHPSRTSKVGTMYDKYRTLGLSEPRQYTLEFEPRHS